MHWALAVTIMSLFPLLQYPGYLFPSCSLLTPPALAGIYPNRLLPILHRRPMLMSSSKCDLKQQQFDHSRRVSAQRYDFRKQNISFVERTADGVKGWSGQRKCASKFQTFKRSCCHAFDANASHLSHWQNCHSCFELRFASLDEAHLTPGHYRARWTALRMLFVFCSFSGRPHLQASFSHFH